MTTRKKEPEYLRGYEYGYQACDQTWGKYGRSFADHQAHALEISARKRDAQAFDKGYAKGYRARLSESGGAKSMAISNRGWSPR
jgi:hypothetical protein